MLTLPSPLFHFLQIATMLQSKTTGDVVEALRFFTRAINFKIAGALGLFKRYNLCVFIL